MFDTTECYQGLDKEEYTLYDEDLLGKALNHIKLKVNCWNLNSVITKRVGNRR